VEFVPRTLIKLQLNCNAVQGRLSNSTPRKLNNTIFSRAVVHGGCINQMAQKVNEATNLAFVQLIDQGPSLYEKSLSDYTRRDKVDLAWERISQDIRESGIFLLKFHRFTKES
jgi:hypothetical protein